MRRAKVEARHAVDSVTRQLPDVDPGLRDEVDADPLVEQMVDRLREQLSGLVALDEYGRPLPWRQVVRVALGPTLSRLRDVETSLALAERVITLPDAHAPARSTGWP